MSFRKLRMAVKALVESTSQSRCNRWCNRSCIESKLPILKWLPQYNFNTFVSDLIAGLTVGMTAIPQGIAYAIVAGLPAQYGLYAGFMGAFVYIFFGSVKDITIGPTAILALMCQNAVENLGADFAILLCFTSGCIIFAMGVFKLGFLVDFISLPVTAGFTSAAAITIACSQLSGLLGIGGKSNDFIESWENVAENISKHQVGDIIVGVSTIVLLLLAMQLKNIDAKRDLTNASSARKALSKTFWLISMSRNAIVVFTGILIAYLLKVNTDYIPFNITGKIDEGLPEFRLPPFSTEFKNVTYNFIEMIDELNTSVITIPLISLLESIAVSKAFSKGKALDATQEMIALGLCNIAGSFVQSIPITGSFTRTAVNNASGVKTPMGGLFTGILVLLTIGFLTTTFQYIPKAVLSGLIICAMFFMVEYEVVPLLWKTKKIDLIPLAATFLACLGLGLEYGIIIGISINLLFILYFAARPEIKMQQLNVAGQAILLATPSQGLLFPAAEYMREEIIKMCSNLNSSTTVVLDGHKVHYIDATVAKVIYLLTEDLSLRGQPILLWNWKKAPIECCLGINNDIASNFRQADTLQDLFKGMEELSQQRTDSLTLETSVESVTVCS